MADIKYTKEQINLANHFMSTGHEYNLNEKISEKQAKEIIKDIKEIKVRFAEGGADKNIIRNKTFKNIKAFEKVMNTLIPPNEGYYKIEANGKEGWVVNTYVKVIN